MANTKNEQDYKIEMIQTDLLQQNPLNSKVHTEEQIELIMKSIQDFGFNDPIETDEELNVLVGHGRLEAARKLGIDQVPVLKHKHLTKRQKEAYTIINNKTTLATGLDFKLTDMVIESVGFDMFEGYNMEAFKDFGTTDVQLEEAKPGKYNAAPLPFQGQKRNSVEKFREVISEKFDDSYTFVDLFGGSGLLSVNLKKMFPAARVVYNDFDNFKERCENIKETNQLLKEIVSITSTHENNQILNKKTKNKILAILEQREVEKAYTDYVTISSNLLYSGYYETDLAGLKKAPFYSKNKKSYYNTEYVKNFHNDLEVRRQDYKELIDEFQGEKVVFIADPPYLSTDIKTYDGGKYWGLKDYLDINSKLADKNFVFFTSNKSAIIELDEWLKENTEFELFKKNAVFHRNDITINKHSSYEDIMVVNKEG